MADDLARPDLTQLDWSPSQRSASLSAVFDHAVALALEAEEWYASKRPSKKCWGRALRVGALVLGAVAVALPIVAEIATSDNESSPIAPGWTSITLVAAASLIALDHYFGFSSGWMRFMATELRVTRLRHAFEHDWNSKQVGMDDPPNDAQVSELLGLARAVVLAVDDAVTEETGQWVTEFRGILQQTEENLSSTGQSRR